MLTKNWTELDRKDFVALAAKMSGLEIARHFGVTSNAVYYRLKMFGIEASGKYRRFSPPKAELAALYKRMSMAKMAEHFGVGETVVFKRLKQHGIGGISRAERMRGKPKSLEHRLAMSESAQAGGYRAGENNGNWKGGKSGKNLRARSKAAYSEWKAAVLANAKWHCQGCGKEHGVICDCCGHRVLLHAHHIKPFDSFPDLRYEASNGKALCERCHWLEHHKKIG